MTLAELDAAVLRLFCALPPGATRTAPAVSSFLDAPLGLDHVRAALARLRGRGVLEELDDSHPHGWRLLRAPEGAHSSRRPGDETPGGHSPSGDMESPACPPGAESSEAWHRGHRIAIDGGEWVYADTSEPVALNPDRACGLCGAENTPEGHDGCLRVLPGVVNACCGHGRLGEAFVVLEKGKRLAGEEALKFFASHLSGPPGAKSEEDAP